MRSVRRAVAAIVGLFMLAGAGLGDAALAATALSAGGPRGAFPLCTPDGTVNPGAVPERINLSDHCDFCPLGGGMTPVAARTGDSIAFPLRAPAALGPRAEVSAPGRRAELYPQTRRGPPLRS